MREHRGARVDCGGLVVEEGLEKRESVAQSIWYNNHRW